MRTHTGLKPQGPLGSCGLVLGDTSLWDRNVASRARGPAEAWLGAQHGFEGQGGR